jgi:hypothetical protein
MSAAYGTNPPFDNANADPSISGTESYGYPANYHFSGAAQAQGLVPPSTQPFPPMLNTTNIGISQSFDPNMANQLDPGVSSLPTGQLTENFSNLLNSNTGELDFAAYQNHSPNSASASEYDSSLLLGPQMHQRQQAMHQAVNPADLVSPISNPSASSHHSSQDPQQSSPGPMSPPGGTPGAFYTPRHSRHTSLDPAAAAYLSAQVNPDWQSMMNNNSAFQTHRRAPSEVSEVSSANHSPFLSQHEYDGIENNASPSLAPQNDPALYDNALGIEQFTLSEQHQQGFSPAHSPYISPRLMPQQTNDMIPSIQYNSTSNQFPPAPTDMYGMPGEDMMGSNPAGDIGQASQMAPPSINVEFAPPSRSPSFGPPKPVADFDSLSPPAMSEFSNLSSVSAHQFSYLYQDPVYAASQIPTHTLLPVKDLRRLQQPVSKPSPLLLRDHYRPIHAVTPALAMRLHQGLIGDSQLHLLRVATTF